MAGGFSRVPVSVTTVHDEDLGHDVVIAICSDGTCWRRVWDGTEQGYRWHEAAAPVPNSHADVSTPHRRHTDTDAAPIFGRGPKPL